MFFIEKRYSDPDSYWVMGCEKHPHRYLHSDGSILPTAEYWPTWEAAEAVLDEYQPKHEWESGDVFMYQGAHSSYAATRMILFDAAGERSVHYIDTLHVKAFGPVDHYLENAEFLFNIKDEI